jgi:HNH endonuclease
MSVRDEVAAAWARRDFLFANVVEKEGPLATKCLVWQRTISEGYGSVGYKDKRYPAHRLFHILARGPIPDGLFCCHHCDVPPCCNSDHLFLGTQADNMQDCVAKGRHRYTHTPGELHGCAILSNADVSTIKGLLLVHCWCGFQAYLAEKYGVDRNTISLIATGETWGHIAPSPNPVMPSSGLIVKRRRVA